MSIGNILIGLSSLVIACHVIQTSAAASVQEYETALTKSLLYFEGQRSGKLPSTQRVQWRGDSALKDGSDANIDLTGGYYDAGDNVKFGFPMAFTITMLSWGTIEFRDRLSKMNELNHALDAIKWGTDYLIKVHPQPDVLYGDVGDGDTDHACWQRSEDMTTPRTAYKIDKDHPGSDLAAETAAAFAAASIAFRQSDSHYANILAIHAIQLFNFAGDHPGMYQNSIPTAGKFYASSGYEDEFIWAAAWLYLATGKKGYLSHIQNAHSTGGTRSSFPWDDKFVGVQVLAAKIIQKSGSTSFLEKSKGNAEEFMCNLAQKGSNNIRRTPGGLLWFQRWNNLQYTTTAAFVASVYAKHLSATFASIKCQGGTVGPSGLMKLAKSQVDYILGHNPKGISYMVGFGSKFPTQVHHRGASIVSIKKDARPVNCKAGFDLWFGKNAPNPNVLDGAIVGGPDDKDFYSDTRSNFQEAEPATANTAPLVGVLASLA